MKRKLFTGWLCLVLLTSFASVTRAEVKRVEMHIAGFLCGN